MAAAGTRRLEELIAAARSLSYQEDYSYTEGWDDNTVVDIFNLGLDRLYATITMIDNPAYIKEYTVDVVASQTAYDLSIDVNMAIRLVDVRYLYGTQPYEFVTLRQGMIQDRFSYPTNIPDTYCIRDGQILLSPTPNITKAGALIINYQKRMRKMDIRRGMVASLTTSPVTFTLDFTVTSQKDTNMRANANSILDKIDYCCIVDRFGNAVVNAIPLNGYNQTTQLLTADPNFTIPTDELAALQTYLADSDPVYVVQGDYSSTHSELDRQCEDHLIEYAILRLLRLSSNAEETDKQMQAEEAVLERLKQQFRRVRPTVYPIIWQNRNFSRSWPLGSRGIVG